MEARHIQSDIHMYYYYKKDFNLFTYLYIAKFVIVSRVELKFFSSFFHEEKKTNFFNIEFVEA